MIKLKRFHHCFWCFCFYQPTVDASTGTNKIDFSDKLWCNRFIIPATIPQFSVSCLGVCLSCCLYTFDHMGSTKHLNASLLSPPAGPFTWRHAMAWPRWCRRCWVEEPLCWLWMRKASRGSTARAHTHTHTHTPLFVSLFLSLKWFSCVQWW